MSLHMETEVIYDNITLGIFPLFCFGFLVKNNFYMINKMAF